MGLFDDLKQSRRDYAEEQQRAELRRKDRQARERSAYMRQDGLVRGVLGDLILALEIATARIATSAETGWIVTAGGGKEPAARLVVAVELQYDDNGDATAFRVGRSTNSDESIVTGGLGQAALAEALRTLFADPTGDWWR